MHVLVKWAHQGIFDVDDEMLRYGILCLCCKLDQMLVGPLSSTLMCSCVVSFFMNFYMLLIVRSLCGLHSCDGLMSGVHLILRLEVKDLFRRFVSC